jgi:hypothetical protein
MARTVPLFLAALLISCASAPTISGPYASRASNDDVQQIKRLAAHHPKNMTVTPEDWAPLHSITFDRPDHARVELKDSRTTFVFGVERRSGKWLIREREMVSYGPIIHGPGDDPEARKEALRPQIGH